MKKFQRSDIVGVERENERDETYRSKTNPQIDGERTRFNHHFISPNGSYTAFINRRLKELAPKRKVKDDAVLMASFFVGASPAFFKDKSRDDIDAFFFECTDFFAERYGKENIISFENCFTRVRAVVKNRDVVSKDSFKALGASGTVFPGDSGVQVIFGPQSEAIVNAMKRVMAGEAVPEDEPVMAAQTLESAEKIMMGKENFVSPATGKIIPLAELADGAFSAGMMGPGFAVVPQADAAGKVEVVSPVNGSVVAVFPTKHAFGIKSDLGKEVVVHVGIDTVDLQGKGFESTVNVGDIIEVGTPLVTFDEKVVKDAGCNPAVVVVITNAMGKTLSVSPMGAARSADDLDVEIA